MLTGLNKVNVLHEVKSVCLFVFVFNSAMEFREISDRGFVFILHPTNMFSSSAEAATSPVRCNNHPDSLAFERLLFTDNVSSIWDDSSEGITLASHTLRQVRIIPPT